MSTQNAGDVGVTLVQSRVVAGAKALAMAGKMALAMAMAGEMALVTGYRRRPTTPITW
jgi:hypothetical protein